MKTIGIDLTPIQGPHRMRGVGSTVINVLRHIANEDKLNHRFVFYVYESGEKEALDLIDADSFPNQEIRHIEPARPLPPSIKTFRGLVHAPLRIKDMYLNRKLGTKRITQLEGIDTFLQFEQDIIPPSSKKVTSVVVAYDLIPYVLESDYLWSYKTARKSHNYSRRGALKAQVKRNSYLTNIRFAMQRAKKVIAISEHTKQDFVRYAHVNPKKITVCHLGVSDKKIKKYQKPSSIERYVGTSWGDIKTKTTLPDTPFLLFVGGADPRRKLADLVHAFNLLRAQGHALHLVLAGDTMLGPNSVPNEEARRALLNSSYIDDIYLLGFVSESTREWLYENALSFIYPSRYEGFGLPILESLQYGTPVITYRNSSIAEISGDAVFYADDYVGIAKHSLYLLNDNSNSKEDRDRRMSHTQIFSWSECSKQIFKLLSSR